MRRLAKPPSPLPVADSEDLASVSQDTDGLDKVPEESAAADDVAVPAIAEEALDEQVALFTSAGAPESWHNLTTI